MANAAYPSGKEAILSDLDLLTADVIVLLIDSADEVYNEADVHISDLTGAGIVARSGPLSGKSVTGGTFDADDPTIPGVSGDSIEALVLAEDTGSDATSRLIGWIDSPAISFTPNGSGAVVTWDPAGILSI